jgi:hypothetical protein
MVQTMHELHAEARAMDDGPSGNKQAQHVVAGMGRHGALRLLGTTYARKKPPTRSALLLLVLYLLISTVHAILVPTCT